MSPEGEVFAELFARRQNLLTGIEPRTKIIFVAVALLIAESKPAEQEIIIRIVTHLLCER